MLGLCESMCCFETGGAGKHCVWFSITFRPAAGGFLGPWSFLVAGGTRSIAGRRAGEFMRGWEGGTDGASQMMLSQVVGVTTAEGHTKITVGYVMGGRRANIPVV